MPKRRKGNIIRKGRKSENPRRIVHNYLRKACGHFCGMPSKTPPKAFADSLIAAIRGNHISKANALHFLPEQAKRLGLTSKQVGIIKSIVEKEI